MTLPIILRVLLIIISCIIFRSWVISPGKQPHKAIFLMIFGLIFFFSIIELIDYVSKDKPNQKQTKHIYNQVVKYKLIDNKYVPVDTFYLEIK